MTARSIRLFAISSTSLLALILMNAQPQELPVPQPSTAAVSPTPPASGAVNAIAEQIDVTVGKSALVESRLAIERVSVGLGDFAVATAVSPYEILLNGKAPGTTSLIVWQQGGSKLFYDVVVRPPGLSAADNRLEGIVRQIGLELPGQEIRIEQEGEVIFLRGRVKNLMSAERAVSIASVLGKTVNLLYVDVPVPEPQILLKVKFASVDRNLSSALGMNLFSLGATNTLGSVGTQQFAPPGITGTDAKTATLSDALNLFLFRPDLNLGATIRALEIKGVLEILSEPNVLAQNGQQASFLAGGEFPFPVVQGSSGGAAAAVTIQFREFGVRLTFLPTITPRGDILLKVAPEVSALDFTHGLTVNGFVVPALTVRKLNTTVDLSAGQSFAIGGLLDNRVTDSFEKVPLLGDIPVLGRFFQSRSRNRENTELVVIVTPEIVRPVSQGKPVNNLTMPIPFLPPNTAGELSTFGIAGPNDPPVAVPIPAIPVETLIKSLQVTSPLQPGLVPATPPKP